MKSERAHGRAKALSIALASFCLLFAGARYAAEESAVVAASTALEALAEISDTATEPAQAIVVEVGETDERFIVPVPFSARQNPSPDEVAKPLPRRGLFVSAATVRRAIESRAIPSGQPVAASASHPGGVAFTSPAGPFRPGDVLVTVGGTRATSEGAVVRAALGAVKSGASAISGEIYRDGVALPFAIAIPPEAKELWSSRDDEVKPKKNKKKKHRRKGAPKSRAHHVSD